MSVVSGIRGRRMVLRTLLGMAATPLLAGCEDSGKVSGKLSRGHAESIAKAASRDVGQVRRGMPAGADALKALFAEAAPEKPAAVDVRQALLRVRANNGDLDSAKSNFFLVAARDGAILRNNLEQDDMAGKTLFQVYPKAKQALEKDYVEFTGSWEVARGVNGRPDAQWLAAARITDKEGAPVGIYLSGWSWSSYAERLEGNLRADILANTKEGEKVPLIYVYIVEGDQVFGAPVAPIVNGQAILQQQPLSKTKGSEVWSTPLEIERREFGLSVVRVPELGDDVVLAVLRSET